jgi:cytochrome P450 family 6
LSWKHFRANFDLTFFEIKKIAGEQWKTLRQKMTTTFSSGKIKAMMPTLTKISEDFIEVLGEAADGKICINYRDMASRFMCEVIGEVAFGLKCKFLV